MFANIQFLRCQALSSLQHFSILPVYLFCLGGLLSCGAMPNAALNSINLGLKSDLVQIRDLTPAQDQNATVRLQGKVAAIVPLVDWQAYQLEDPTGKIWVLTNQANVQLADQVIVQGILRFHSIPVAGQDFGEAYVEQQQIERVSAE